MPTVVANPKGLNEVSFQQQCKRPLLKWIGATKKNFVENEKAHFQVFIKTKTTLNISELPKRKP